VRLSAIEHIGGPTILVGHSYGGAVITNAGYNNPNVTGLVYVTAFAPDEGQSLSNLIDITKLSQGFLVFDNGGFAYINPAMFRDGFAQDVTPAEAQIISWLGLHGVNDGWKLAQTLAAAGLDTQHLDTIVKEIPSDSLQDILAWLDARLSGENLLDEVKKKYSTNFRIG
jgi:pimeloyl-ACP methyl ester carboxylesterase